MLVFGVVLYWWLFKIMWNVELVVSGLLRLILKEIEFSLFLEVLLFVILMLLNVKLLVL